MDRLQGASEHDWLGACRIAAQGVREVLERHPTSRERILETGSTGEGGDSTLIIDAEAEQSVFDALDSLYKAGARFTAISEERGVVGYGSDELFVVIDPIDGSLNAKRGMPGHALSIAVATGMTMDDVFFGYVLDFGTGEEWRAGLGGGAFLDDRPLDAPPERRDRKGRLELLALESASPRWLALAAEDLQLVAYRVRAIGAVAISLCQVAETRVDAMATLRPCRSVDAAAAQLIVRESGGVVAFLGGEGEGPLGAPLDLEARRHVIAARSDVALEQVAAIPIAVGPT